MASQIDLASVKLRLVTRIGQGEGRFPEQSGLDRLEMGSGDEVAAREILSRW
jgi:hypothetical protein